MDSSTYLSHLRPGLDRRSHIRLDGLDLRSHIRPDGLLCQFHIRLDGLVCRSHIRPDKLDHRLGCRSHIRLDGLDRWSHIRLDGLIQRSHIRLDGLVHKFHIRLDGLGLILYQTRLTDLMAESMNSADQLSLPCHHVVPALSPCCPCLVTIFSRPCLMMSLPRPHAVPVPSSAGVLGMDSWEPRKARGQQCWQAGFCMHNERIITVTCCGPSSTSLPPQAHKVTTSIRWPIKYYFLLLVVVVAFS